MWRRQVFDSFLTENERPEKPALSRRYITNKDDYAAFWVRCSNDFAFHRTKAMTIIWLLTRWRTTMGFTQSLNALVICAAFIFVGAMLFI
jgi:hypothetical protein